MGCRSTLPSDDLARANVSKIRGPAISSALMVVYIGLPLDAEGEHRERLLVGSSNRLHSHANTGVRVFFVRVAGIIDAA